MNEIIFYAAIILVIAIVLFVHFHLEKKRTEALKRVAMRLGLMFEETSETDVFPSVELDLFSRGRSKSMINRMTGKHGSGSLAVYGYQYTIGHGKNSTTHAQTVAEFRTDRMNLPAFELCPENVFHKIGQIFGYQDIDFNNHGEFSKNYLLRGNDEQRIRQLFNPMVMKFFENNTDLSVEGHDDTLIVYRAGKRSKPEEIQAFITLAKEIQSLFNVRV